MDHTKKAQLTALAAALGAGTAAADAAEPDERTTPTD